MTVIPKYPDTQRVSWPYDPVVALHGDTPHIECWTQESRDDGYRLYCDVGAHHTQRVAWMKLGQRGVYSVCRECVDTVREALDVP